MTGPLLASQLVNLAADGRWTAESAQVVLVEHQIRRAALTETAAELLQAWAVRLRSAFDAANVESRCAAINELLIEGTTRAYLTTHDQLRPHLHFSPEEDDVVARVKAVTAGGLAIFAVESEGGRLGVCARASCGIAFVDTSRNGLRAYCSARCGNNDAVRRYREQSG
ncbi:CGNR zinc finger domain-containing protein [Arthrobacter sp. ISL-48]|uniref:CGNR zinc finger domain-containing protein n=1 Tax=Arthrobacter sp. ISL-48 TaxID=2819110 RepID=UPI0020355D94|nr:CGNR zinc finger domain-containing protein [Arthrobacter sp. ISL-48]